METPFIAPSYMAPATLRTIYDRRSVRSYSDKEVDLDTIERIIDAGRMAPSAMNRQPWRFYVLTDKELIHSFSKQIYKEAGKDLLKKGPKALLKSGLYFLKHLKGGGSSFHLADPIFYGAPVVIFLTAPENDEWASLDIGMCAQNMMLAAKSLGLDSCPLGFAKYVTRTKVYSQLKVPDSEHVFLGLAIGYGKEVPGVPERKKNNLVLVSAAS